jgi:hypothetical protein
LSSLYLAPYIAGILDADNALSKITTSMNGKKAIAIILSDGHTSLEKHGYRARVWKPRGYISDYNFFTQRYRPLVSSERPELNVILHIEYRVGGNKLSLLQTIAINSILGNLWKGLSKQERRLFEDQAEADKLRYWQVRNIVTAFSPLSTVPVLRCQEVEMFNNQVDDASKIVPKYDFIRRHVRLFTV